MTLPFFSHQKLQAARMGSPNDSYVVKIANLAITTKEDDIRHMFGYIGRLEDCQMYPRK